MAGPGGGPPRKSHTKSRKGCKTCKKRHIRCDETFPQCQNCSKHNCRCDYMDQPAAGEEPLKGSQSPDLMMGPELQRALDRWRMTGECPIPELRANNPEYWTHFSTIDLRLIHHMATLSIDLQNRGYSSCTAWAPKMPILIAVGLQSDFVMSAVLALSACHLAWQTKNPETENLAYYHKGVALKGLHEAIGAFSRENSEAILAASMLLSWQATEWRSWASLQQGVSTVMNAMRPWIHESELALYIEGQRSIARARTPVTPTFAGAQSQPHPEDLGRLQQAVGGLNDLRLRLANNQELLEYVEELIEYIQQIQQDFPLQAPDEAFSRLQAMRSWLFWLPPQLFRPEASDVGAVAVMSHFYAVALALEPIFPEIGGAYLGSLSISPIERMHSMLLARRASHPQETGLSVALTLIEGPVQIASAYSSRQRSMAQTMESQNFRANSHSPYLMPQLQLASTPEMPTTTLYSNSPVQSPGSLRVPGSPYFPQANTVSSQSMNIPRRESQNARPAITSNERSMSVGGPLSNVQFSPQQDQHYTFTSPGAVFHEAASFAQSGYGGNVMNSHHLREDSAGKGKDRQH